MKWKSKNRKGKREKKMEEEKERRKKEWTIKNFLSTIKYKFQDRECLKQLIFPVRRSC